MRLDRVMWAGGGSRSTLLACGLTVSLLVTACDAGSGDDRPGPTTTPSTPLVAPFTIEKEPLWPGAMFSVSEVRGATLVGALAEDSQTLVDFVDAATGRVRWSLQDGALPGGGPATLAGGGAYVRYVLVGNTDVQTVAVPYVAECSPAEENVYCLPSAIQTFGVALLSGVDGRVVGNTPMLPIVSDDDLRSPGSWDIAAVGGDIVIGVSSPETGDDKPLMIAADTKTGNVLWELSGVWPLFVEGDVVHGVSTTQFGGANRHRLSSDSTVVAVDVKTGQRKWDLSGGYAASFVGLTVADVAVVYVHSQPGPITQGYGDRTIIIDASTGDKLADLGETLECVSDGANLIACGSYEAKIASFEVSTREAAVRKTSARIGEIHSAWRGYLVSDYGIVDRAGTLVVKHPSTEHEVWWLADGYAVVRADTTYTVHQVDRQ